MRAASLSTQIEELATSVGRLQRRCAPDSSLAFLAGMIAEKVELLDCMISPTAADRYADYLDDGWDEENALALALDETDDRARSFRARLAL